MEYLTEKELDKVLAAALQTLINVDSPFHSDYLAEKVSREQDSRA